MTWGITCHEQDEKLCSDPDCVRNDCKLKRSSADSEGVPTCAHISYCSASNAPALPKGPCDCGASEVAAIAGLVYPDWIHLDDKEPADQDIIGDVTSTARRIYEAGYRKQGDAWEALERHGFPPEACDNLPQAIDNAITCLIETRESLLAEMKVFRAPAQPARDVIEVCDDHSGRAEIINRTKKITIGRFEPWNGTASDLRDLIATQPSPAATVEAVDITESLNARQAEINESMARPDSSAANEVDELEAEISRLKLLAIAMGNEIHRLNTLPQPVLTREIVTEWLHKNTLYFSARWPLTTPSPSRPHGN